MQRQGQPMTIKMFRCTKAVLTLTATNESTRSERCGTAKNASLLTFCCRSVLCRTLGVHHHTGPVSWTSATLFFPHDSSRQRWSIFRSTGLLYRHTDCFFDHRHDGCVPQSSTIADIRTCYLRNTRPSPCTKICHG